MNVCLKIKSNNYCTGWWKRQSIRAKRRWDLFVLILICVMLMSIIALFDHRPKKIFHETISDWSWRTVAQSMGLGYQGPWFFKNGKVFPRVKIFKPSLWPWETADDRIVNQLMFVPKVSDVKKIYFHERGSFRANLGNSSFQECPVKKCAVTSRQRGADAVVFRDSVTSSRNGVPPEQIWVLYVLENPYHSGYAKFQDVVNWTATYRSDSDIVTPYEKWVYYDETVKTETSIKNYAVGKTKKVAWFVSNCRASNNRLEYAKELAKYISVDIYGHCGDKTCLKKNQNCLEMLDKDYKFYLSFENGNCRDYITEKFFVNGLQHNVLPIVMGAHPDDYYRVAPEMSYIHVDEFLTAKDLAEHLNLLDSQDDLYSSYFSWKNLGEFINTHFLCRLCALLHDESPPKHYADFRTWWINGSDCRAESWYEGIGLGGLIIPYKVMPRKQA